MALEDLHETLVCPLCGRLRSECQAPENEDGYVADLPTRCHATTALDRAQDGSDYQQSRALLWSTRLLDSVRHGGAR